MKLLQEFKEFAVKGNMMDMAIGIIIGASFNSVIDVLVKKVMMPPLSQLSDGVNLENKKLVLRKAQTNEIANLSSYFYWEIGDLVSDLDVLPSDDKIKARVKWT